jgi:spore coat polysaccharide biosynthesis protein SpsF (cytidylyltransferase family)
MILRNVAIIQARLGSSRFPKKMLNTLDGKPLIEWVIRRLLSCKKLNQVVLATTDVTEDDRLADIGKRLGVIV